MKFENYSEEKMTLKWAIDKEDIETCRLLLNRMSNDDINSADKYGQTWLIYAVYRRHTEICKLLLDRMSDDAIDK